MGQSDAIDERSFSPKLRRFRLKEGFDRANMVEAVLNGSIIEDYADAKRVLVCGKTVMTATEIYLHVVCEYADPVYVEFVTAYIPDEQEW